MAGYTPSAHLGGEPTRAADITLGDIFSLPEAGCEPGVVIAIRQMGSVLFFTRSDLEGVVQAKRMVLGLDRIVLRHFVRAHGQTYANMTDHDQVVHHAGLTQTVAPGEEYDYIGVAAPDVFVSAVWSHSERRT